MIDYPMVRKTDHCLVKVISSEECVPQYRMVIGYTHEATEEDNCQVCTKAGIRNGWMKFQALLPLLTPRWKCKVECMPVVSEIAWLMELRLGPF